MMWCILWCSLLVVFVFIIKCEALTASNTVTFLVSNTKDNYPAQASYCATPSSLFYDTVSVDEWQGTPSSLCNLRSAWLACNDNNTISTFDTCTIVLPRSSSIQFNSSLAGLVMNPALAQTKTPKSIVLAGNNASMVVSPIPLVYQNVNNASFPYTTATLSNTNNALKNYAESCVQLPGGVTVVFSTCNNGTQGDTYLRLYQGNTNLISNDDFCGDDSQITYITPSTIVMGTYCLRMGCYGSSTCSMRTTVRIYFPVDSKIVGFGNIFYANLVTSSSIATSTPFKYLVPSLTIANLTSSGFNSTLSFTSMIYVVGSLNLHVDRVVVKNAIGQVYVQLNNTNGSVLISNSGFNNLRGVIFDFGNFSTHTTLSHNKFSRVVGSTTFVNFGYNNSQMTIQDCSFASFSGSIYQIINLKDFNAYFLLQDCSFTSIRSMSVLGWRASNRNISADRIQVTNSNPTMSRIFFGGASNNILLANIMVSSVKFIGNGGLYGLTSLANNFMDNIAVTNVTMLNCYSSIDSMLGFITKGKNVHISNVVIWNGYLYSAPIISIFNCTNVSMRNLDVRNVRGSSKGGLLAIVTSSTNVSMQHVYGHNLTSQVNFGPVGLFGSQDIRLEDISLSRLYLRRGDGGGIYVGAACSNVTMQRIAIESSVIVDGSGGGIYIAPNSYNVSMTDVNVTGGSVSLDGGGLYVGAAVTLLRMANLHIVGNRAGQSGGGIFLHENSNQVSLVTPASWAGFTVLETSHPYNANAWVDASVKALYQATVQCPHAAGYLLAFDAKTSLDTGNSIVVYTNSSRKVQLHRFFTDFPGATLPTLVLDLPSFYLELRGTGNYPQYPYGFKLYVYPLFANDGKNVIADNVAGEFGGGMSLYFGHNFPIILNTIFRNNQAVASDGGGLNLRFGTRGLYMQDVDFIGNSAGYNGGGMVISSGLFGSQLVRVHCHQNYAVKSGGCVYLGSSNGYGTFPKSNEVNFTQVRICNNSAQSGGGLFAGEGNNFRLYDGTIDGNLAQTDGGGIMLQSINTLVIHGTSVLRNAAANVGGGIVSNDANQLYVTNSSWRGNEAGFVGGAMVMRDSSTLYMNQSVLFQQNRAGQAGGGLVLLSSALWASDASSNVLFAQNQSPLGSALLLYSLVASTHQIQNTSFIENDATQGGTVFWIYDADSPTMSNEPAGLRSASVVFGNNLARYGDEVATQARTVVTPPRYNVTVYGDSLSPSINVTLLDFYQQAVAITGLTSVYASVVVDRSQCKQYPYLAGVDMFGQGVDMLNGIASFAHLEAYCSPAGNMTVKFEAMLGSLTILPANERSSYAIANTSFLSFRTCQAGEYENVNGMCQPCPSGAYSLLPEATECKSCVDTEGVHSCGAHEIVLKSGYWRRYASNSAVQRCLLDPASCPGGNQTGDAACAVGHEGPLCAVCSEGYFLADNTCQVCVVSNNITPTAIALIILFVVVGSVVAALRYGQDSAHEWMVAWRLVLLWLHMKYSEVIGKLKIIVSTFQIIIATSMIFQVQMPTSFTLFSNSLKFVNLSVGSIVPFGCTQEYNFMDTLLVTTLVPIAIGVLLTITFLGEYLWLSRSSSDGVGVLSGLQMKYLNYFFYVTYLILPSLTTTIFQIFICHNVDPQQEDHDDYDWYLVADMSISCETDYYRDWLVYAVLMIALYPIGIPVLYFYLLYTYRREIKHREDDHNHELDAVMNPMAASPNHRDALAKDNKLSLAQDNPPPSSSPVVLSANATKLAFLWEAYSPRYWYWEIIETFRRLVLTAVLSVCAPGTSSQTVFGSLLAVFFIKLYAQFNPYADNADGTLAEIGQWQVFVTFFTALVVQNALVDTTVTDALGVLVVLLNMSVFAATLYYQVQQYQEDKRLAEEQAQQERLSMLNFRHSQRLKIQKAVAGGNTSTDQPRFQRQDKMNHENNSDDDADDDVVVAPVPTPKPAFRRRSVQTLDASIAAFDQAVQSAARRQPQSPPPQLSQAITSHRVEDHQVRQSEQGFELTVFSPSSSPAPGLNLPPVEVDDLQVLNDQLRRSISSAKMSNSVPLEGSFRSSMNRKDIAVDSDDDDDDDDDPTNKSNV